LPLLSVLGAANLHVTHSSSTVIEAEQMGVSSLVWSRYGEELFVDEIQRGAVRVAGSASTLEAVARQAMKSSVITPGELLSVASRRDQAVRYILTGAA
jgi:hypothetical protein